RADGGEASGRIGWWTRTWLARPGTGGWPLRETSSTYPKHGGGGRRRRTDGSWSSTGRSSAGSARSVRQARWQTDLVAKDEVEVEVGGEKIRITSPDRVVFPRQGWTKMDVVEHFLAVVEGAFRGIADRPTM